MSDQDRKSAFEALLDPVPLPSSADRMIAAGQEWWKNACVNHYPNMWTNYAVGYKETADVLVTEFVEANHRRDPWVHPIMFLYRQYLELALKDLIRQARRCLHRPADTPLTHKLDDLWIAFRDLLVDLGSDTARDEMQQIGRLIGEFMAVDPLSTAFRYPEDRNGSPSLPGIRHIDVANVRDVIDKISTILDGADAMIDEYLSFQSDMMAEAY
jgi:hypothetical protein